MRVIFLTITFHPEPAIHGLPLAKCLAARGYEVKVLTAFPQYPIGRIYPGYRWRLWQWETVDGIRVLRVPIYPSHDDSAVRRMLTYLSFALAAATVGAALIGPADLVYLYEPPPTNGLASLVLKAFRGTPVVHDIADMWPETVVESGLIPGGWLRTIATSLISAWCRFLYRRAEAINRPGAPDRLLGRELGFDDRFNIVYAGNLGFYQALESVIRAAALVKEHRRIQVVIAGTGPKEEELKTLARELRADNVLFLGRRHYWEMSRINDLADVLLIHLKDLGFLHTTIPGKTQVSLASGRPILMAVRGDAADLVRESGAGVICEPEDPAAIARTMVEMSRMQKEELEAMGRRGRRYYEQRLALDIAGEHFDRAFREAAAPRLADGCREAPERSRS